MGTIPREAIASALTKKGFVSEECAKHIAYYLTIKGKQYTVRTFLSRGSTYKDYGDTLLSLVKKQMRFETKEQFLRFVECNMDGKEYLKFLVSKGAVHPPPEPKA